MHNINRIPVNAILEGIPRIGYDVHLCPFPGAFYACLKYLGDPLDYDILMGVTGAAFRRLWNRDDGGNVDLSYFGDEPFRRAFEAAGYEYRVVPPEKGAMIQAIRESIARGVPPISFGVIGPPEAGIVAGYQGDGGVLFGWSYFQEGRERYYEKAEWFETMDKGAGKGRCRSRRRLPGRRSGGDCDTGDGVRRSGHDALRTPCGSQLPAQDGRSRGRGCRTSQRCGDMLRCSRRS
jgi:hypothetical protein